MRPCRIETMSMVILKSSCITGKCILGIDNFGPLKFILIKSICKSFDLAVFDSNTTRASNSVISQTQCTSRQLQTYLISLAVTTVPLTITRSNLGAIVRILSFCCSYSLAESFFSFFSEATRETSDKIVILSDVPGRYLAYRAKRPKRLDCRRL